MKKVLNGFFGFLAIFFLVPSVVFAYSATAYVGNLEISTYSLVDGAEAPIVTLGDPSGYWNISIGDESDWGWFSSVGDVDESLSSDGDSVYANVEGGMISAGVETATFGQQLLAGIGTDQSFSVKGSGLMVVRTVAGTNIDIQGYSYAGMSVWADNSSAYDYFESMVEKDGSSTEGKLAVAFLVDDGQDGVIYRQCYSSYTPNSSPVPVPGAVWLLGTSLAGLVGFRRRKG